MRLASFLRVGVTAAALGIILWRVPLEALWSVLADIDPAWLLPASGAVCAMLFIRWIRWHALLRAGGVECSEVVSARSLMGGFALGAVMPGRLGELGRCLFMPGTDRARVVLLNIVDRALDMWALGTFMVGSLFLVVSHPPALIAVCFWLTVLPFMIGLPRIVARLGGLPWWGEALREQLRAAGSSMETLRVVRYATLALLSTGLDLLAFYFLLRAFQDVRFVVALATFPWIVTAGGLPISVGGLGTREGVAAILLARFAIPASVALDVSLLLFAFTGLLPAIIGLVWHLASQGSGSANRANNLQAADWKSGWRFELERCLEGEGRLNT
ncbi:MAG: flippase-like domain-containing protein [Acidobacteria bacterium]|nr:flippase-like domain-containing protein [Acidobacteriota bacterium]